MNKCLSQIFDAAGIVPTGVVRVWVWWFEFDKEDIWGVVVDVEIVIGVPLDDILFDLDCGSFLTLTCDDEDDATAWILAELDADVIEGVTFITLLMPIDDDWTPLFSTADAEEAVFK